MCWGGLGRGVEPRPARDAPGQPWEIARGRSIQIIAGKISPRSNTFALIMLHRNTFGVTERGTHFDSNLSCWTTHYDKNERAITASHSPTDRDPTFHGQRRTGARHAHRSRLRRALPSVRAFCLYVRRQYIRIIASMTQGGTAPLVSGKKSPMMTKSMAFSTINTR